MYRDEYDVLFSRQSLRDWLQNRLESAEQLVNKFTAEDFARSTDDQLAAGIRSQLGVSPIVWDKSQPEITKVEREIDVSDDPRRARSREGPVMIPGTEFIYSYQFSGTTELLWLKPMRWSSSLPRASVGTARLKIGVLVPTDSIDVDEIGKDALAEFDSVKSHLSVSAEQVQEYSKELPTRIRTALAKRRASLSSADAALEELRKRSDK